MVGSGWNWRRVGRVLSWGVAACALAFVASVIPVRDRCWDPGARGSTRLAISREPSGCILHVRTGDVHITTAACARLECEPGLASTLERMQPSMLVALLALYAIGTLAWAARWRML